MSVWVVALAALATALATGLGAVPLVGRGRASARCLGAADAIAVGVMLAATVGLAREAGEAGVGRSALGLVAASRSSPPLVGGSDTEAQRRSERFTGRTRAAACSSSRS
jgi:hypothetical protein